MWSTSLPKIDEWLDGLTMYRLTIYYLAGLLIIAGFLAMTGVMGYSVQSLVVQTVMLIIACLVANYAMAWWTGAPAQWEPTLITALILALILGPIQDGQRMVVLWAAGLSIASKYVLSSRLKHWFNPAAIGVVLLGLGGSSASWWVGTATLLPWVIIGGVLLARKLRREKLVTYFLVLAIIVPFAVELLIGEGLTAAWRHTVLTSPMWFLGFVMLTEPVTMPATRGWQYVYVSVVAVLSWPFIQIGGLSFTPELALVAGNALTVLLNWKPKAVLTLVSKTELAPGLWDFAFTADQPLQFISGQYLDWTIDHGADSRGKRRMFTVASSPTESLLHLGVKVVPNGSSFKRALTNLGKGETLVAGSASGDFTLPKRNTKMAWVAGGVGITPYRSMTQFLLASNQAWDTVLLFGASDASQLIYRNVFEKAAFNGWLRPMAFIPTGVANEPWQTVNGRIDADTLSGYVPDYKDRLWYISGSQAIVASVNEALRSLGVPSRQIRTDYFAGLG